MFLNTLMHRFDKEVINVDYNYDYDCNCGCDDQNEEILLYKYIMICVKANTNTIAWITKDIFYILDCFHIFYSNSPIHIFLVPALSLALNLSWQTSQAGI